MIRVNAIGEGGNRLGTNVILTKPMVTEGSVIHTANVTQTQRRSFSRLPSGFADSIDGSVVKRLRSGPLGQEADECPSSIMWPALAEVGRQFVEARILRTTRHW